VTLETLHAAAEIRDLVFDKAIETVEDATDQEPQVAGLLAVLADLVALLADLGALTADVLTDDREAGDDAVDVLPEVVHALREPVLPVRQILEERRDVGHGRNLRRSHERRQDRHLDI